MGNMFRFRLRKGIRILFCGPTVRAPILFCRRPFGLLLQVLQITNCFLVLVSGNARSVLVSEKI
jgi:hypothetical protein